MAAAFAETPSPAVATGAIGAMRAGPRLYFSERAGWTRVYVSWARAIRTAKPWGNAYVYLKPGVHHRDSYDVFSMGPDGVRGTEDDVAPWLMNEDNR